jgi:hypothetical protein
MTWWPGWDSIESTKGWADFYFWFGIICLVLLAISEVISHRYGLRKDELVAVAEVATSKQRKADQDAADSRHATEISGLKKTLSEADKKVTELERIQQPRHLTAEQKGKLTDFLTKHSNGTEGFTIHTIIHVHDARAYADEIANLFNELGWNVRVVNAEVAGSAPKDDIWITARDAAKRPRQADLIFNAFLFAKIPIQNVLHVDETGPAADEIWLTVGAQK